MAKKEAMSTLCHACASVIKSDKNLECERCKSKYCSEDCYKCTLTSHLKHCKTVSMFQKKDNGDSINIGDVLGDAKHCLQSIDTKQIVECFKTLPFDTLVHALGAIRVLSSDELDKNGEVCEAAASELYTYDFLSHEDTSDENELYLSMYGDDQNSPIYGSPKSHVLFKKNTWEVGYWESNQSDIEDIIKKYHAPESDYMDQVYKWLVAGPSLKTAGTATDKSLIGDKVPSFMKPVSLTKNQTFTVLNVPRYSNVESVDQTKKETLVKTKRFDPKKFGSGGFATKKELELADGLLKLYWTYPSSNLRYPKIDTDAINQEFWSSGSNFTPPDLRYAVMAIKINDDVVIPYIIGVRYSRNISDYNIEEEESIESAKLRRKTENVQLSKLNGIKKTLQEFGAIYYGFDLQVLRRNGWFLFFQHYFEYLANLMRWSRYGFKTGERGAETYWDLLVKYRHKTFFDARKTKTLYNKLTLGGKVPVHFPTVLLNENVTELRIDGNIMLPSRFYEPSRLHKLKFLEIGEGLAENVAILLWDKNSYEEGELELDIRLYSFTYCPSKPLRLPETLKRAKNLGLLTLKNVVVYSDDFNDYGQAFDESLVSLSLKNVVFFLEKENNIDNIDQRKVHTRLLNAFLEKFLFLEALTLIDMNANDDTMRILEKKHFKLLDITLKGNPLITEIPDLLQERISKLTADTISNTGSVDTNNIRSINITDVGFPDNDEEFMSSEDEDADKKVHKRKEYEHETPSSFKKTLTKKAKKIDSDKANVLVEQSRLDAESSGEIATKASSDPIYNIYIDSTGVNDDDDVVTKFATQTLKGYGNLARGKKGSEWISVFVKCESQPVIDVTRFVDGDELYDKIQPINALFKPDVELTKFEEDEVKKIYTANEYSGRFTPITDSRPNGVIIRVSNENDELVASTELLVSNDAIEMVTSESIFIDVSGKSRQIGKIGLSSPVELAIDNPDNTLMRFLIYNDSWSGDNIIIGIIVLMQTVSEETPLSKFGFTAVGSMKDQEIFETDQFIPDVFVSGPTTRSWFSVHLKNGVRKETAKKMETLWMKAASEYINIELGVKDYDEDVNSNIDTKKYITWKNMHAPVKKIHHWKVSPKNILRDGGWKDLVEQFNGPPGDGVEIVGFIAGELENEARSMLPNKDPLASIKIVVGRGKNKQDIKYKVSVDIPRLHEKGEGISSSTAWISDNNAGTTNLIQFTKLKKTVTCFGPDIHFPYCDMKQTTVPGLSSGALVPIELDISMSLSNTMIFIGMQVVNVIAGKPKSCEVDAYSYLSDSQTQKLTDWENSFRHRLADIAKKVRVLHQNRKEAEGNHQKTVDIEAFERMYREKEYQKLIFMYFLGLCVDELYNSLGKEVQNPQVIKTKWEFDFLMSWIVERTPNIDIEVEENILQPQLNGDDSLYADAEGSNIGEYLSMDVDSSEEYLGDATKGFEDAF